MQLHTAVTLLMMLLFTPPDHTKPTLWVVDKGCSLKVDGSTNINKFSCIIPDYSKPDTLTFYKDKGVESVKLSGSMRLNITNFDCHNLMMTKDLQKTLKAKEYPQMVIKFLSLSRYPNHQNERIKGLLMIELAGVAKKFEIDYQLVNKTASSLSLIGKKQLHFSDFNIIPPRKLGGMIQTKNELNIEFTLNVKVFN